MKFRSLSALAASMIALSGVSLASTASAAVPPQRSLYSSSITVHTANGKAWHFSLSLIDDGSTSDLSETLLRSQSKPVPITESHTWEDSIPSSFTFDSGTGHGKLKTPSSVAALTTLNLSFTPTGRRKATCASGSKTYWFGNLTGRVTLKTQLRAGGTVNALHATFPQGRTEVIDDAGCVPLVTEPCYTSMYYQANYARPRSLFGTAGPRRYAKLSHEVALNNPPGAHRSDVFSTRSSRAPLFDATKHTLQVWAAASGPFTGTGRFTGGGQSTSTQGCTVQGVSHTEHIRSYTNATFRNGANHPLIAHTSLVGKMGVPDTTQTYYEFDSWS